MRVCHALISLALPVVLAQDIVVLDKQRFEGPRSRHVQSIAAPKAMHTAVCASAATPSAPRPLAADRSAA
jgi:hypothetical protein